MTVIFLMTGSDYAGRELQIMVFRYVSFRIGRDCRVVFVLTVSSSGQILSGSLRD